jgi:subtilisin family serine protease
VEHAQVTADDVWPTATGEGIVVSNIDTGVMYTHTALVDGYRGNLGGGTFDHNYNWWDPYGDQPLAPYDYHSHGSHTTGTMVGRDYAGSEIGSGARRQWIACNGFDEGGRVHDPELLECAEFILAPWDRNGANADPDMRPDIVNNSWGGGPAQWWYNQAVYACRAAGIFPVFSGGNDGPNCNTVHSPSDMANIMAVGATDMSDSNVPGSDADFSSRGPTDISGTRKPDVSAPGANVISAYNNGNIGGMSGTSMAAPHVAGEAALLWSAVPELRATQLTYWVIEQSALDLTVDQGYFAVATMPRASPTTSRLRAASTRLQAVSAWRSAATGDP